MSKTTTVFAKWDLISELIINKYKEELALPLDFKSHFNDQFRILKDIQVNGSVNSDLLRSMSVSPLKTNKILSNEFQDKIVEGLKFKGGLDDNQFITIGNSTKSNFIWIDDRITSVLNISKKNFSVKGILGIDEKLNIHHPMDVSHYIRYRTLAYFINSLKGIDFTALKDYYSVKFRIGLDLENSLDNINKSTKLVEQKCYGLIDKSEFTNQSNLFSDHTYHLDVWTVSEYPEKQNYVSTNLEIIGNATKTRFINLLFYMANAKLLGFQPKELVVLHFLDAFDTTEESRSRINRQIRLKSSNKCEFENKAFTDFSYLLNKKLTKALKIRSLHSENNTQYFNSLNRLTKARKLGLLPLPSELKDAFITTVCNS